MGIFGAQLQWLQRQVRCGQWCAVPTTQVLAHLRRRCRACQSCHHGTHWTPKRLPPRLSWCIPPAGRPQSASGLPSGRGPARCSTMCTGGHGPPAQCRAERAAFGGGRSHSSCRGSSSSTDRSHTDFAGSHWGAAALLLPRGNHVQTSEAEVRQSNLSKQHCPHDTEAASKQHMHHLDEGRVRSGLSNGLQSMHT